jgi:hypothetical protein
LAHLRGTLMVIGAPDTGKSTFAQYLYRRLCAESRCVAYLDGDPGQEMGGAYGRDRTTRWVPVPVPVAAVRSPAPPGDYSLRRSPFAERQEIPMFGFGSIPIKK